MDYKAVIFSTIEAAMSCWSVGGCKLVSDILLMCMAVFWWREYRLYLQTLQFLSSLFCTHAPLVAWGNGTCSPARWWTVNHTAITHLLHGGLRNMRAVPILVIFSQTPKVSLTCKPKSVSFLSQELSIPTCRKSGKEVKRAACMI